MNFKLIIVTSLFFCLPIGILGGNNSKKANKSSLIQAQPVLQMFLPDLDCSAHSLKDAILGIKLFESEGNAEQEKIIKNQMLNLKYYQEFTKPFNKNLRLSEWDITTYLKKNNIENVFYFDTETINHESYNSLQGLVSNLEILKELAEDTYIKSFTISTGGSHLIACTIKKVDGNVIRAISMESSNAYAGLTPIGKVFKKNWLSVEQSIQRVIDIANDKVLVNKINLYKKYQMYLQMAERIAQSFGGINFVFDYLEPQKNPDLVLSEDLILDFTEKFTNYIRNTDDDQIYKLVYFIKNNKKIYVSKIEFLQMLFPDSTWWTDNSLFSDKVSPSGFLTKEEQAEIIKSIGVQKLLEEEQAEIIKSIGVQNLLDELQ